MGHHRPERPATVLAAVGTPALLTPSSRRRVAADELSVLVQPMLSRPTPALPRAPRSPLRPLLLGHVVPLARPETLHQASPPLIALACSTSFSTSRTSAPRLRSSA